jgi:hypothetical protein
MNFKSTQLDQKENAQRKLIHAKSRLTHDDQHNEQNKGLKIHHHSLGLLQEE